VKTWEAVELLAKGLLIRVCPLRPEHAEALERLLLGLSARSVYQRFHTSRAPTSRAEISRLTKPDFVNHVALAASLVHCDGERLVGVARFVRPPESTRAEVALLVADGWQGRGIGRLLLKHLVEIARGLGIEELEASVLSDNLRVLRMVRSGGDSVRLKVRDGLIEVSASLQPHTPLEGSSHHGHELQHK
jgi:GNAT superfamily N-acetyltransferase